MADSSVFGSGERVWQRAHIMAAANYLREQLLASPNDRRLKELYEGLLEVLDPSRRAIRIGRDEADGAGRIAVRMKAERRVGERRSNADRRRVSLGAPERRERRKGKERRVGDRRKR